ncbi:Gfo/Idh/MocA family protein [Geomicrobium sp. JCM 19039]|uniref:Gfo/Idh/MocA family protein n=1 Tax=Geomicrobium sp. JCM 19039 TaxID=1460636 RepID=UPI00045F450B|nr:Gfo/Idh/MocA family oxidoreductase [Geomicrobium sp. JCM 19039]GAK13642.1 myo-inositol 2-dehydrogenase [Geomicrobium sp. JCM 19039]
MTTFKVGIVGCGSIAVHRHLPEYHANKHAEIAGIFDPNKDRAQAMADQYGARAYTTVEELLESDVDIISVCAPNVHHASISIAALDAGKHVLCEKPMAASVEEAEAMIDAEKRTGKTLMIAHNQRFVPSHVKARELIKNGEIGAIYSVRTTFGHGGPEGWSADGKDSWFFDQSKAIVGALGDLGVHKADLVRFLLGEEIAEVSAFTSNLSKPHGNVEDNALCILQSETGKLISLSASWSYRAAEDNSTIIYGEKGMIRCEDDPEHSLIIDRVDGETEALQLGEIQTNDSQGNSGVIDAFIHSLATGDTPPVTGTDGLRSLEIILAALQSSKEKRTISITKERV